MGYRLNRLDEPVFMAGPKPMRTEFGIHLRLESCGVLVVLEVIARLRALDVLKKPFNGRRPKQGSCWEE